MSRKVFITSDISIDERLAEAAEESPQAALLWPWLLTALDDWGRSVAEPKRLKYAVFPAFASVTPQTIEEALALFAQVGLITRYAVDGKAYFAVPQETWFKYQTHIRTEKRESDRSRYPAPTASSSRDCAQVREDARDRAQVRALADKSQPSPSPSPSPSPTLSTDGQRSSPERERMLDTDVAADAALSLMAPALSATSVTSATLISEIPSNITPLPIAARPPATTAATAAAAVGTATSMATKAATGTKATARVHDPVWDACIAAMGQNGGAPSNRLERGRWAKGIQALKESLACDGSPPSEIAVRAARYRARFGPSVPLNPMALAGNWTTVAHDIPPE